MAGASFYCCVSSPSKEVFSVVVRCCCLPAWTGISFHVVWNVRITAVTTPWLNEVDVVLTGNLVWVDVSHNDDRNVGRSTHKRTRLS